MATTSPTAARPALGRTVRANLPTAELYEDAIRHGEGLIAAEGPLVVRTGQHTGRSPEDKFIVDEPGEPRPHLVGHGQPADQRGALRPPARPPRRLLRATATCTPRTASSAPHPGHRRSLRVYTETAWASLFARNLFRRPTRRAARGVPAELHDHLRPVVQGGPGDRGHPHRDGDPRPPPADGDHHRRHRVRGRDQEERVHGHERPAARRGRPADALGGQRRRGGRLGRSSSGCRGPARRRCRPTRGGSLIGDDEHGWGGDGVFNFEGGCYAKTIRLSPMYEPDIFQTTRRFGTVLENVDLDPRTRELDLDSERFTENTRGAYPLDFIGNADPTGIAGQPRNVVFLTADAFGVLPPISRLTREQAAYHFISGYTAKLAGTEVGVKEPKATFSACFGAPFMPRHPGEYAAMLVERLERWDVPVWLVNTGWTGGPYGVGERMNIAHTRSMVRAALDGQLDGVPTRIDPIFGVEVPTACPDVPAAFLDPRSTWADPAAYDERRPRSRAMFARQLRGLRRRRQRRGPRGRSARARRPSRRRRLGVRSGRRTSGRPSGPSAAESAATVSPVAASAPRTRTAGTTSTTNATATSSIMRHRRRRRRRRRPRRR